MGMLLPSFNLRLGMGVWIFAIVARGRESLTRADVIRRLVCLGMRRFV